MHEGFRFDLNLAMDENSDGSNEPIIKAAPFESKDLTLDPVARSDDDETSDAAASRGAATSTINERLMAELKAQETEIKSGGGPTSSSRIGKRFASLRPRKTDAEREAAVAEARDLNGVNPFVAIFASLFAFLGSYGLWTLTTFVGGQFAAHPVGADAPYTFQRLAAVFRNIVMGGFSLMSGFFGVIGLGVLLLGFRVLYGVTTGELDPTPIKRPADQEVEFELSKMWDLMTGKQPGKRRRR